METNTAQQESTMKAEPQKEHHWLQQLVGYSSLLATGHTKLR